MPEPDGLRPLYRRVLRIAVGLGIAVVVLVVLLYRGLRIYTVYATHRVEALLADADGIRVGAAESSILPLVAIYGGVKLMPDPPRPLDDCPNKAECRYRNARIPDYTYAFDLSPFHVFSPRDRQAGRIHHALQYLMYQTPSFWRDPFSLRDWIAYVAIPIRVAGWRNEGPERQRQRRARVCALPPSSRYDCDEGGAPIF